jgi:hypothetical protein
MEWGHTEKENNRSTKGNGEKRGARRARRQREGNEKIDNIADNSSSR